MTPARATWSLVAKESRALVLPVAAPITVMLAASLEPRAMEAAAFTAYMLGVAAVGAMSVGHEYTSRTLPLALSAPVSRRRMLAVKWSVMAAGIAIVALAAEFAAPRFHDIGRTGGPFGWLPVLCGLFLAPWLTMVCRSPLAGTIFALVVPGALLTGSALAGSWIYGWDDSRAIDAFQRMVLWRGTIAASAAGAVLTWRTFMTLQAIDGSGVDATLPSWLRRRRTAATVSTAHPLWKLALKELRLQQMLFLVALVYVVGWLVALAYSRVHPDSTRPATVFSLMSIIYGGLVFLIAGAIPSAEERQLGTLEPQQLLPIASRTQWIVKVSMACAAAAAAGLLLPVVLAAGLRPSDVPLPSLRWSAVPALSILAVSLYVSSAVRGGMRALLISVVTLFGVLLLPSLLLSWTQRWYIRSVHDLPLAKRVSLAIVDVILPHTASAQIAVLACALLLLRFALTNHRAADQSSRRVFGHVVWTTAAVVIGAVAVALR